ncbi:hypothetical protein IIA15_08195 [candidate division TA06 bacterium]|nr:hypothetical protein [candidate division TA06 bacterium]
MRKYRHKTDSGEIELPFAKAQYREQDFEELYELRKESTERAIVEQEPLPEERVETVIRSRRIAMPGMEPQAILPLKLMGSEVVGSLFDRVEFLRQRIEEITETLELREHIHNEMVVEIEVDIKEKNAMAERVADINEKRNLKLDVSSLRREKRMENVQWWRDVVELRSEMREHTEKYETEKKIVAIFSEISPDGLKSEEA